MSSVPHTTSSASNSSPRLRPGDGGQENKTHAQLSVPVRDPPADRQNIDLEIGYTEANRSFHEAVLTIGTAREHNYVSTDTGGPSGSTQQPRAGLPEVASSRTSNRPAPRQGRISDIMGIIPPRRPTFLVTGLKELDPVEFLIASSVKLGSDDFNKVANHLETLRRHKPITILDALFRHSLFFSRAKLYQLFLELRHVVHDPTSEDGAEPTSESTSFRRIDDLRKALEDYSRAMDAYRTFRKGPGEIDSDDYMMFLAGMLTELDTKRSQLKVAQGSDAKMAGNGGGRVVPSAEEISSFEAKIAHVLVSGAKFSPAGVRTEEELKARLSFLGRLAMAILGGAALIAPMLIMSLRPSKLTGLLTTSLFVVGVAVALAWFMKDAAPKDVLAATAAYAAVLVVFVGTDGV